MGGTHNKKMCKECFDEMQGEMCPCCNDPETKLGSSNNKEDSEEDSEMEEDPEEVADAPEEWVHLIEEYPKEEDHEEGDRESDRSYTKVLIALCGVVALAYFTS